jgi:hypothetical protein
VVGKVGEEDHRLLSLKTGEDPIPAPGVQSAQKLDAPPLLGHLISCFPRPGGSAI